VWSSCSRWRSNQATTGEWGVRSPHVTSITGTIGNHSARCHARAWATASSWTHRLRLGCESAAWTRTSNAASPVDCSLRATSASSAVASTRLATSAITMSPTSQRGAIPFSKRTPSPPGTSQVIVTSWIAGNGNENRPRASVTSPRSPGAVRDVACTLTPTAGTPSRKRTLPSTRVESDAAKRPAVWSSGSVAVSGAAALSPDADGSATGGAAGTGDHRSHAHDPMASAIAAAKLAALARRPLGWSLDTF
jgi:hypothetical protein